MPKKSIPFAICYDFDGTLAPGNMQERDFIPEIGMNKKAFWNEVKEECKQHDADEVLVYMKLMLQKAEANAVSVRKSDFEDYGNKIKLFNGVQSWFTRINSFGKSSGLKVSHHIISSGIREMIAGTKIAKHFENVYASSFCYDHHGIAKWPALALNYTTKTQYLFRINKGVKEVYDHETVNQYIPPEERPIPFSQMVYIGDGLTDVPCFRLVKSLGGTSVAVYKPSTKGARARSEAILSDGRVNFVAPADFQNKGRLDKIIKANMDKVAADAHYLGLAS